jgi:hypothetical protein
VRLAPLSVALALTLLAVLPGTARAEESGEAAEAAEHFRRAGELYGSGRYQEALAEFQRAHDLAPHASNLFNMARCHENLGEPAAALDRYREALGGTEGAEERADIERRIAAILERPVRVFVTSQPSGARVLVDARAEPEPGTTPMTLELVPRPHRLTADGFAPTPHRVEVVPGEPEPVEVSLTPMSAEACPTCPPAAVVERCHRVDLSGLKAHLALSFPIGIPIVHQVDEGEGEVQILAGVGVAAHLTHNQVIVGGRLDVHPYAKDFGAAGTDRAYSLIFGVLEAGYVWALEVAVLRLTGGLAVLSDLWTEASADGGGRDIHVNNALFGWGSAGLDVHALRWLSIGLDAGLGVGGATSGGFELFGVVSAVLAFHV